MQKSGSQCFDWKVKRYKSCSQRDEEQKPDILVLLSYSQNVKQKVNDQSYGVGYQQKDFAGISVDVDDHNC